MPDWDDRYRSGEYEPPPGPSPLLKEKIGATPPGRALDIATGTGRNARFLAERGYDVEAIDSSGVALDRAREAATSRGLDVEWIRADIETFDFPIERYDVITMSFFRALDRLPDVKASLAPGGVLFHEHHLRSETPVDRGPGSDRFRFAANDLLRFHLDLTVLYYEEGVRTSGGRRAAVASLMARKSSGPSQTYPDAVLDYPT